MTSQFFCYKYLMLSKNNPSVQKNPIFWQVSDRPVTFDVSFFRSSRSFYTYIHTFYFYITLFPYWNFFCGSIVILQWRHWRYISLWQKLAWRGFSVTFIIYLRIVNTMCLSKEKAVCHYVDPIVKVFEGNSKIIQGHGGRGGLNAN